MRKTKPKLDKTIEIRLTNAEWNMLLLYYQRNTKQTNVRQWQNELAPYVRNHLLNIINKMFDEREQEKKKSSIPTDWLER